VERIAEDHGGRALVRDVGAATIDVCAPRGCGLDRYLVDDGGAVDLTETPGVVQRLGAGVLVGLFVVAWLGIPPAAASRYGVVGMVSAIVVVLVGGVWLGNRLDPERRLRRGHDGAHWAEIVTRVPDSD
jgi:hypothetical protein